MKQCKSCRTRAETESEICPVCGIDQKKECRDLTDVEQRIRHAARHIRVLAMLHLIFAALVILALYEFAKPFVIVGLAVLNIALAYGLVRFSYIAYKAAIVCYFFFGIVNVISIQHGGVHLGGIAFALIALYIVGNRTAKSIFERKCPGLM